MMNGGTLMASEPKRAGLKPVQSSHTEGFEQRAGETSVASLASRPPRSFPSVLS
jgi:hypothetical protein